MPKAEGTPKTSLERLQASRDRTGRTYSKARNAAEREVVARARDKHPRIYERLRAAVDAEHPHIDRVNRQARVRSAVAAWFRETHRKDWDEVFDRHIRERTAEAVADGFDVTIRRRTSA